MPAGRELSVRAETFFESNAHHEQILFMPHKNILHVTCRVDERKQTLSEDGTIFGIYS